MTDRQPWTPPRLHTIAISLDTAYNVGSNTDGLGGSASTSGSN